MKYVKKSIDKRALHKREYDSRVNKKKMQTTEEKVDTSNALDASLVDKESSRTASREQDTSSRSGNDAHANDVDIRPIYDEEPMAEVQLIADHNVFVTGQQHTEQPKFNNEGEFASQIDVNNDLSKPITTYYLPKERESTSAKPHYVIASSESRNSSKNMPRFSSNDMIHNHYLDEAKKKTQESGRNSRPSVMLSAKSQNTTKHSRSSRKFSDSKHFVCSTCQKCVFNANHDACVTKFLNEVNSRAMVPSHKTTTRYKPVEQISIAKKLERQIPTGHMFSIKKTSTIHEKTTSPRSCLRRKKTGRIFKTVGLRWVPTRKIFTSSTTKVDSEPTNGLNNDITNQYECKKILYVSADTLNLSAGTSFNPKKEGLRVCSELRIHDHNSEPSSSKLVPKVVPLADKTAKSQ
ncbi:hypothetical protein Tco_0980532 [Tanacetum coccineum]